MGAQHQHLSLSALGRDAAASPRRAAAAPVRVNFWVSQFQTDFSPGSWAPSTGVFVPKEKRCS